MNTMRDIAKLSVCWECSAVLSKQCKFRDQASSAQRQLWLIVNEHNENTAEPRTDSRRSGAIPVRSLRINIHTEDSSRHTPELSVCWECSAVLSKQCKFRDQASSAQRQLWLIVDEHNENTAEPRTDSHRSGAIPVRLLRINVHTEDSSRHAPEVYTYIK
ncbi:unnamed protein product [Leptidea sinapis]|uniref:Uncharacterized protein n=1 Tax=Leptidea sinapis TaxID=189913 RepID=A0A5E4QQV5_9NEOP|nr:unnamed protein product [Leptidea sinapis]